MRLRRQRTGGRVIPTVIRANRTAIIDNIGHTRSLHCPKVHFRDEPVEERKYLAKRRFTAGVKRHGGIDNTVTEPEIHKGLVGTKRHVIHERIATSRRNTVAETVLVAIVEDQIVQLAEPVEHRHFG